MRRGLRRHFRHARKRSARRAARGKLDSQKRARRGKRKTRAAGSRARDGPAGAGRARTAARGEETPLFDFRKTGGRVINKKRKLETSRATSPQNAAAIVAPAIPKTPGGDTPKPDAAASLAPTPAASALPSSSAASTPKPGPGRPATRAHCLRCAKRIERCSCKDGVLLPVEVHRAVDEAKKR